MEILGYIISLIIGVILGLIGGGGAILTIPLVIYFFGASADLATSYSLVVVTFASLFGVVQRINKNLFALKEALVFVFPSMFLAFVLRKYREIILPHDFELWGMQFTREGVTNILLIVVMLYVGIHMLRTKKATENLILPKFSYSKTILLGVLTGCLSGFLGAGGGFIIVPILMTLGLDIRKAVATSLLIIVIQSGIALLGDYLSYDVLVNEPYNWTLLAMLVTFTVGGVFIGTLLQHKLSGKLLRIIFAWVLLIVAFGISIDRILIKLL